MNSVRPSLDKSCINLNFLRDDANIWLQNIMSDIDDDKSLIIESELSSHINLMYNSKDLNKLKITTFDILKKNPIRTNNKQLVYIIRPLEKSCYQIINHMTKETKRDKIYHIIFLPNSNVQCKEIFHKYMMKCLISVKLYVLPITLIPIDYDILSMEYPSYIKTTSVNLDLKIDLDLSSTLIYLQKQIGIIPIIQGVGNHSQIIIENMLNTIHENDFKPSKISRLIIIDRECDYITPLLSQNTYSALIDETFKVNDNCIKIPEYMFDSKKLGNSNLKDKVINSNDVIYESLRDKTIDNTNQIIIEKVKELRYLNKSINTESISSVNKSVKDIKLIEDKFPKQLLTAHFNMIEEIIIKLNDPDNIKFQNIQYDLLNRDSDWLFEVPDYLNPLDYIKHQIHTNNKYELHIIKNINNNKSPLKIFRVLCLYCIVNDGISIQFVDQIKTLMIKQYGANCCFIFEHLFNAGILFPKNPIYAGNWFSIKNTFSLVPEIQTCDNYNGYIPLSYRIIEKALNIPNKKLLTQKHKNVLMKGIGDKKIKLSKLPISFHVIQETENDIDNLPIIICFVGGITHSEIALLRALKSNILIITTKIINGNTFMESMI